MVKNNEQLFCTTCGLVLEKDYYLKTEDGTKLCIFCLDDLLGNKIPESFSKMNKERLESIKSARLAKKLMT
jgi:hypothetical protein